MNDVQHKRYLSFLNDKSSVKTCKECGKTFDIIGMPDYIYKRKFTYYCSWSCFKKGDPDKK